MGEKTMSGKALTSMSRFVALASGFSGLVLLVLGLIAGFDLGRIFLGMIFCNVIAISVLVWDIHSKLVTE